MALKIKWSKRALYRYQGILEYLQAKWTEKEIADFINRTEDVLKAITLNPQGFKASSHINVR